MLFKEKGYKNGENKKGSVKSTRRIFISDSNLKFQIIGNFRFFGGVSRCRSSEVQSCRIIIHDLNFINTQNTQTLF